MEDEYLEVKGIRNNELILYKADYDEDIKIKLENETIFINQKQLKEVINFLQKQVL